MDTLIGKHEQNTSATLDRLQQFLNVKLAEKRRIEDLVRERQSANERLATDVAALVVAATAGRIKGVRVVPDSIGYSVFLNSWQVSAIVLPQPEKHIIEKAPAVARVGVKRKGLNKALDAEPAFSFNDAEEAAQRVLVHILEADTV